MSQQQNYIDHLKGLSRDELEAEVDRKISDTYHDILDSAEVRTAIAVTNASGWGVDDYEVSDISLADDECLVKLSYSATGDQEDDATFNGNRVSGEAEAVIDSAGAVVYQEVTASVDDAYERDEDNDA